MHGLASVTAQAAAPELPSIHAWEQWGPLGVILAVIVTITLSWFFVVALPGAKKKQDREERESEARSSAMTKIGDATSQLAVSHGQQTHLLGTVVATQKEHGEKLEEHTEILRQIAGKKCPVAPPGA